MSYQEAYQEPYTKYPNRYNDVIKPLLTGAQRDVCDVVIRMTYGWHQTSAAISNTTFARKANKSIPGIIGAKKQLQDMGLLIVLERGGGSRKGEYTLDLWYDDPDKSVKASIIRQEEQLQKLEEMENSSLSDLSEENGGTTELLVAPITVEPQPETEENSDFGTSEPQAVDPGNYTPQEPDSEQEISHTEKAEDSSNMEDSETSTSKLSLPPYIYKTGNNIPGEERKQTVDSEREERSEREVANPEKKKKKKAAATVRYRFLSLFPETRAGDDWQFFGWATKTYGFEVCISKLDYMKEHRKLHSITNPKGFFRTALARDFQPPAFIVAKLKADGKAEREIERCRKENQAWERRVAEFSYEKAAASLQKLLDTLD